MNEAIIDLVFNGRLNAVSCMVVGERFTSDAERLINSARCADHEVQIGLHLTLTEYRPLTSMPHLAGNGVLPSVRALLAKSHVRMLSSKEIKEEIQQQWRCFVDIMGREPDFIDGHQHVHLFPVIRSLVIEMAEQSLRNGWVRSCHADVSGGKNTAATSLRTKIISALSKSTRQELIKSGMNTNSRFYGINNFMRGEDYGNLMREWLHLTADRADWTVIMCHPGRPSVEDDGIYDPISGRRPDELAYLEGADFLNDLQVAGLSLDEKAV